MSKADYFSLWKKFKIYYVYLSNCYYYNSIKLKILLKTISTDFIFSCAIPFPLSLLQSFLETISN